VAAAGFLLASKGHINLGLLVATLVGLSLVVGSSCVFNNYIDRGIDAKMSRTKRRALVTQSISARSAIIYAVILGLAGSVLLGFYTNALALGLALFGFFAYVVMYGIGKRRSVHGTVVGSISGALPPVVGYTAVTGRLDAGAVILFLILVLWQMPHFYAIAIYRLDDYAAAKIPVLPLASGLRATKIQILVYIGAFMLATGVLNLFGYAGVTYLVVTLGLGAAWLVLGLRGFKSGNDELWARKMFRFSLLVITGWCIMISLNSLLP